MSALLVITVAMADDSDFDWLRERCVPAVEDAVATAIEEERLDGDASVTWDRADDDDE